MAKEKLYTVKLTSKELWELMNNFDASFEQGGKDNEIADKISIKLHQVWDGVPPK